MKIPREHVLLGTRIAFEVDSVESYDPQIVQTIDHRIRSIEIFDPRQDKKPFEPIDID